MDKKFILRLKEFYTLETFQVAFYEAQVSSSTNEYETIAFEKMVKVEGFHLNFFAQILDKAKIGRPTFTGSLLALAGGYVGEEIPSIGSKHSCKLGVALENKAITTYLAFIEECMDKNYSDIRDTLMEFQLEEEFHTLWLKDYMRRKPQ